MIAVARWVATVSIAVAPGGCGATATTSTVGDSPAAPPPPTLPATAVDYLPSSERTLHPAGLAREARSPGLARELAAWGYLAGADRYFQGESRKLQVVDSRTLSFSRATGASAFVSFTRAHAAVYLGSFPGIRRYASRGRAGFFATAQACACHLANPAYLAVVARGPTVTWLEINGPGATPRALSMLIARAP